MKERTIEIQPDEKLIVTVKANEQTPSVGLQALKDRGKRLCIVGLLSDEHLNSEPDESECINDFVNAIDYFRKMGADFLCNLGDICQYKDDDLKLYNELYTEYAWAPTNAGLRIFTSLGNHDYMRLFSNGQDLGKLNNYIAPFTGEDYWKQYGYAQKTDYIQFFEYDGQWDKQLYGKGRTVKSKLSYWVEMHGDIYVFLSIDYGSHANPAIWDWCVRGMNLLDYSDKYVQQMMDYVRDTPYDDEREADFDYQFYNPNSLIWLKDIIENNKDKRIFVFAHHFLSNKAGDTNETYSHLRIWPYSSNPDVQKKYYAGSNTPTGLTFWFLNKLAREHLNVVWFSGHSHYAWMEQEDMVHRHYDVKQPTGNEITPIVDDLSTLNGTQYDYRLYTTVGHSVCDCAPSIHLPSLSQPVSKEGLALYGASEGGLMDVYEHGVVIKCIRFKDEGSSGYTNKIVKTIEL